MVNKCVSSNSDLQSFLGTGEIEILSLGVELLIIKKYNIQYKFLTRDRYK